MAPNLPFDILVIIIEESGKIPRPNFRLLRAFASTCRTLRPEALKHIYRDIRLLVNVRFSFSYWEVYDVKWQTMEKIIAANPSIAGYVKEVIFLLRKAGDLPPGLLRLLAEFKNLYRLECGHHLDDRFIREQQWVEWGNLPESTRQGWSTVFQMPSRLRIENFRGIPVSELQVCKRLTWISIDLDSSLEAPVDFVPRHSIPLTKLGSEAPFESIAPVFLIADQIEVTFLNLEQIDDPWTDEDCERLKGFPKLKRLHVKLKLSVPSFFHHLAPNVVQNLESFTMRIRLDDSVKSGVFASTLISGAMQPGFPSLEAFYLEIHLEVIGFDDETLPEFDRLDRLFASRDVFPVLERLQLTLAVGPCWGSISAMRDWRNEDTARRMPLTVARLMHRFEPKMRSEHGKNLSPLPVD